MPPSERWRGAYSSTTTRGSVPRLGRCLWPRVYEVVGEGRDLPVEVTDDRVAGAGAVGGSGAARAWGPGRRGARRVPGGRPAGWLDPNDRRVLLRWLSRYRAASARGRPPRRLLARWRR